MIISFVGMSGCGKSHWSKLIQELTQCDRLCCDDLIEAKLDQELTKIGFNGIKDVARWMGQPFEPGFKEAQIKYLNYERQIMKEILKKVEEKTNLTDGVDLIIDTSGSVIHTGRDILVRLSRISTVVHIETPPHVLEEMIDVYMSEPKPVIWGHIYNRKAHESHADVIRRCYPLLLSTRESLYKRWSNLTLGFEELRQGKLSPEVIMNRICSNENSKHAR